MIYLMDNIDFNRCGGYKVKMRQPFLILGPPRSATTFLQQSLSMNGAGIYEPIQAAELGLECTVTKIEGGGEYHQGPSITDKIKTLDIYKKLFTNNIKDMHPHLRDNLDKPYFIKECSAGFLMGLFEYMRGESNDLFDFFLDHDPSQEINTPKAIWIFRDPLQTYASFKEKKFSSFEDFVYMFKKAVPYYETMNKLYPDTTVMVTQGDFMGGKKEEVLRRLCKFLDIEFTETMLHPEQNDILTSGNIYLSPKQLSIEKRQDYHGTIRTGVVLDKLDLLSDEEISVIKAELTPLYERIVAERRALPSLEDDPQLIPSL